MSQPEEWACPLCTFNNAEWTPECSVCGGENPNYSQAEEEEDSLETPPTADSTSDEDEPPGPPWECSACTFQNDGTSHYCQMCESAKP